MSNAYEFNYESDSQESVDEAPMEKNDLVLFDHGKNITVIFSPNGSDEILRDIKEKVESVVLDVSTQSGREQIRSLAFKIARTKTGLDKMGKNLKAEFKARCDAIDSERAKIWDELERLQEKVRKPLTDFENKEKERVAERESRISQMASVIQTFDSDSTADRIRTQIDFVTHTKEFDWQEFSERADSVANQTLLFLQERLEARVKRDAEIAELERLRKEKEERERKEREDKIAAEAAEKAKKEAEAKAQEEARIAKEKADKEKREAEEQIEKERKAKENADKDRRAGLQHAIFKMAGLAKTPEPSAHPLSVVLQSRIDAINAIYDRDWQEFKVEADEIFTVTTRNLALLRDKAVKDEEEAAKKAERDRIDAENERKRKEEEERQADIEHRSKINNEALKAVADIVSKYKPSGADPSKEIVEAIIRGNIPHVKINY